jgi:hypothetical protein
MYVGEAEIAQPLWVYLSFMRRAHREKWFVHHPMGIPGITGVTPTTPPAVSIPSVANCDGKWNSSVANGNPSLLEIEFDGRRRDERVDFRPHLPLIFQL